MRKTLFLFAIFPVILSCNQSLKNKAVSVSDDRPKSQLYFNHMVDSLSNDYQTTNNSAKADLRYEEFKKYALDSLKEIKDWVVLVNEVSDYVGDANSTAPLRMDLSKPIYNLKMYSVIRMYDKINPSLDSVNLPQGDVIFLTYTTPKSPKDKKFIDLIKSVNNGDTLLVSGSLTHINQDYKIDFKDMMKTGYAWNFDLLASEIKKK